MTDLDRTYEYPAAVRFEIYDETIGEYVNAAEFLNGEDSTLFRYNTNTGFSAVRLVAISPNSCRGSKCRLSRRCIRCSPNRRQASAT